MNDWPEFTIRSDAGEGFSWSRYASDPVFAALTQLDGVSSSTMLFSGTVPSLSMAAQSTRYRLKFTSMKTPKQALQPTATR